MMAWYFFTVPEADLLQVKWIFDDARRGDTNAQNILLRR